MSRLSLLLTPSFALARSVMRISLDPFSQMGLLVRLSRLVECTSLLFSRRVAYGFRRPTRLLVPSRYLACSTVNRRIPVLVRGGGSPLPSGVFVASQTGKK